MVDEMATGTEAPIDPVVPEATEAGTSATEAVAPAAPAPEPVRKTCSPGLTTWMKQNRVSLAFTSYQSGRLYLLGADAQGRLSFHERIYQRAMGIVGNASRLYMGGLYQVCRFENILADSGTRPDDGEAQGLTLYVIGDTQSHDHRHTDTDHRSSRHAGPATVLELVRASGCTAEQADDRTGE